jgi:PKD domain
MLAFTGLRSWMLTLAVVLVLGVAVPATASAASFGELSRFGSAGIGNGQFNEAGVATEAFGVDPTDNSVYVGDKPAGKTFRIQKLSSTGAFLGAATITASTGEAAIEGVAVDPSEHRLYALLVLIRSEGQSFAAEVPAAGALYAFSTEPNGAKVLEPAAGTEAGGVLASKAVLRPQSTVMDQPLLEPSGLAVDPVTHDIVLAGAQENSLEEPRTALERVSKTGVLGARWTDDESAPFFEEEVATSPVVTSTGKVYVVGGALTGAGESSTEQIDEIPADFTSSAPPKPFIKYESGANELVTFPGIPAPLEGGGLSIGADGTLWAYAKILVKGEGESGFKYPGALAFTASGATLGWTGGQSLALGTGKCAIGFEGHPMVAAGKNGELFVFDSNHPAPSVIRFGPEGSGCPTASSSPLLASVAGKEVGEVIAPGSEVTLASTVAGANALKVKWSFGDGSPEAVTTGQHQAPVTLHKFVGEGEFKVVETIETDDLASPTIVLNRTLTISKPLPLAHFTAAVGTPLVGQVDAFDAKTSTGSEKSAIIEYKWDFGDGATAVTSTPSTTHAYGAPGSYTVKLLVLDANARTSKPFAVSLNVTATPGPPTTTTTSTTPPIPPPIVPPPGQGGVLPYQIALAGSTLTATKAGALAIKINCVGKSSCTGRVTLKTASAVSAGKHKRKAILTLAAGSLKVLGGHIQVITLHLSAAARTLLAHSGSRGLRARVTIVASDSAGKSHTTLLTVTIHAAKKHH